MEHEIAFEFMYVAQKIRLGFKVLTYKDILPHLKNSSIIVCFDKRTFYYIVFKRTQLNRFYQGPIKSCYPLRLELSIFVTIKYFTLYKISSWFFNDLALAMNMIYMAQSSVLFPGASYSQTF